ncbi:unnamed protein product [Mytilus coruscus]|uniref:C-type lectin domain-containing protein n=1 Tax=Mytilus coruscus TaxID=42192 RepID=A0A6J8A1V6_MYTCO|nr:unnamed protein product [Mytilus coruscus]
MVWETLLQLSVLIGFYTKEISGNDNMYRCPEHLSRNYYLKTFGEKCYRYEKSESDWPTARSRCTREGGDLIQIRNQATQSWVMSTLNDLHWNTNGVWIGAHDRHIEMDWRWVTGDKITWNYWASGQPNCDFFCSEDCGNLRRDDGGRWHDKLCDSFLYTYSYICQYNMKPATTTTTTTTTTPTTMTIPTTTTTTNTKTSTTPTAITNTTIPTTITSTVTVNQTGKLSGVIVASVLGAITLLILLTICFYRTRKKKSYTDKSMFSSNSGISKYERSLNDSVRTGNQNVCAEPKESTTCQAKLPNVSVIATEFDHYSEIPEQKMAGDNKRHKRVHCYQAGDNKRHKRVHCYQAGDNKRHKRVHCYQAGDNKRHKRVHCYQAGDNKRHKRVHCYQAGDNKRHKRHSLQYIHCPSLQHIIKGFEINPFPETSRNDEMYRCPDHLSRSMYLKTFGEECYRYEKTELYRTTARSRCAREGDDIIQIRNQATQNWVMITLDELHYNKNGVWIGAHDRGDKMNWRWVAEISGNDDMYRCPEHLSRTIYLKTFHEKCYRYERSESYWTTAKNLCTGEGGDLIQIRNQATQNWVMSTLHDLHWNTNGVWIGAHDRDNEMDWRWVTEISGNDDMYRCPEHLSRTIYLKTFHEKCYRYERSESYWTTAKNLCTGEGGDLIQIRNQATQNWVMSTLHDLHWNTNGVWIGAHDRDNEMDWRWVTGDKITWNNWASGQPNCNWFCVEDCGNLRRDDGGRWHDKLCSFNTYSYICQYGEIPEVIIASVLGALALLMLLGVCFFRTIKKKSYTITSILSSISRISKHERSLNEQVCTGDQNVCTEPNKSTACQAKQPNVSVIAIESGHFPEISEQKMVDKLNIYLPKYDNNEYEKCSIAKSKVGVRDSKQYLCADNEAVYESVSVNETASNVMNEQLETSKNQYEECGNLEGPQNVPSHYIEMDGAAVNNAKRQPSSLDDIQ